MTAGRIAIQPDVLDRCTRLHLQASEVEGQSVLRKDSVGILVAIAYGGVIAYLSLRAPGDGPPMSHDKLAHMLAYLVFAVLALRVKALQGHVALVCLGIVFYSAALEFGQSLVPGRHMSGLDLLANTLGVVLGACFCRLLWWRVT